MAAATEKAVLILGPRNDECEEIRLVKEYGHKTVLINQTISLKEALLVDVPMEIDLNDEEQVVSRVLSLIERYEFVGIFTLNEYRVPLSSKIAEQLGIQTIMPHEAALNCRYKKRTREKLTGTEWEVKYALVKHENELLFRLPEFDYPLIVKPSNESGSKNVFRCEDMEQAWEAVSTIRKNKTNLVGQYMDADIIVEEYLDGPEYSVEAITINGKTEVVAITQKETAPFNPVVETGHIVPALLLDSDAESMRKLVSDTLRLVGVNYGVTHTEVKLTKKGPRIVEVNARPGGDRIPDLVQAATGIDLRKAALHIILGGNMENMPRNMPITNVAAIQFLASDKNGIVTFNQPPQHTSTEKLSLFITRGQEVTETTNNHNRLGYFIIHAKTHEEMKKKINHTHQELDLSIEPETCCK